MTPPLWQKGVRNYGAVIFSHSEGCLFTLLIVSFIVQKLLSLIRSHFGEGNGTPLQYSCLENPMDGGAWWAAVHGVAKSQTQLSNITFTFHFHALKKEMATYSSVLAWRIPATGEPGGLLSMGSHRVRHDWSDLAAAAAAAAVEPLGFSIYKLLLSTNSVSFTFPFQFGYIFLLFPA